MANWPPTENRKITVITELGAVFELESASHWSGPSAPEYGITKQIAVSRYDESTREHVMLAHFTDVHAVFYTDDVTIVVAAAPVDDDEDEDREE